MSNFINFFDQHSATILLLGPLLVILIMGLIDIVQTKHTIRRNFPIIGILRYLLELIGPELRQYLFHDERSDRPLPRYLRTWVYANSKRQLATVAFGTKKDVDKPGTMLMRHSHFPINSTEAELDIDHKVTIGSKRRFPYQASLFNISAMSYGALGKNAVKALGNGAKAAGCYHNTGEGGVSKYHIKSGADLCVQIGTAKFGMRDSEGNFDEGKFLELAALDQVKCLRLNSLKELSLAKVGSCPKKKSQMKLLKLGVLKKDMMSFHRHVIKNGTMKKVC